MAPDRPVGPLTIHKIRRGKGRGSILNDGGLSIKVVDIVKQGIESLGISHTTTKTNCFRLSCEF